ncbi:MAG: acylneuraminate cytidylyltransferase family protein [Anaerolineae bacterium]|nr:acylneuraminate cytidylyltransferase family protein [Anaerolineae bacterium]
MITEKEYILGAIFARGGSKGVPRKNIRPLAGKPLIGYAIETALASKRVNFVVVSTDDEEIAEISRQYGAQVPFMRPVELARDDTPEWLAWRHTIQTVKALKSGLEMAAFVSIPPTAPLRHASDVDACIQKLLGSDADIVITVKKAERNPYFNMVSINEQDYAHLVIPPKQTVYRRQDAPQVYDMTTVAYAARPDFILNASSIFDGKVQAVVVPSERALDIDTELDFQIAALLLEKSR